MSIEDAAGNIAGALAPRPQPTHATWRWGTVAKLNADGTMDVAIGGATLPSVRALSSALDAKVGDRVRVDYLGTDAVVTGVRAADNRPLFFRDLGTNPTTTATDTSSTWAAMGSGAAWISGAGHLNGQPTPYGFVASLTDGYDVAQLYKMQRDGGLWVRGGNDSGGFAVWHLIPYVTVFYASGGRATITLARDVRHLLVSTHNSTPELNGIAIVTGATVWKVAGASSITYTHSGTTVTAVASNGGNPAFYLIPLE